MSKYEKFSREELLALVEKQEGELASKKYGLVWDAEREPEQVVLDCAENFPVLKRVKGREIRTNDGEDNILIEGDNYHALTVLNYTHKEKIDVIYIDPPYNTGNKDFKYNDRFVDKEDGFRHSKWLNFMEKRLNLAKDLLKPTGVIFISIDDNEQAQLKMLCDKIFGQENFVTNIIWQSKTGASDAKTIDTITEYILVYVKSHTAKFARNKFSYEIKRYRFKDQYENERGAYYPDNLDRGGLRYSDSLNYPITCPDGTEVYPNGRTKFFNDGWTWKWGKEKVKWGLENGYIEFKKTNNKGAKWSVYYKNYMFADNEGTLIERSAPQKNIISDIKTGDGASTIKELFENHIFKYSKPVQLIERLLGYTETNHNPIILDFMAGSGTTGHAVLKLNKEDGGNRKFILCTNNEELDSNGTSKKHNICTDICYPRIQKVIKGYKKNGDGEKVAGLGGNLQYFTTALVKDTKNSTQVRIDVSQKCAEMLCVRENIFNVVADKEEYKIFASNKKDVFLCVYFSCMETSFAEFLKEIKKLKGKKIIYIFSPDEEANKSLFAGISDYVVETIPEKILKEYRRLAKINIPIKAETIFIELEKAQKKIFEEKDKDDGARVLRIVLAKTVQKIAQKNNVNILKENKGEKTAVLNDTMYKQKIFNKVQWEENKTCLAIGNNASHGEYDDYDLKQVENFYQHIRSLLNDFGI